MIEATVMRTHWESGAMEYELQAKGHAGAGDYGRDIVCAAISCLAQTLAYKVEEAAKDGMLHSGGVQYGNGWMKVNATPKPMAAERVAGWFSFVQDGVDAVAEQYPENVELQVQFLSAGNAPVKNEDPALLSKGLNLQLFSDGGDGAESAGSAESGEAESALELPKLRPAEERLARRSGTLKKAAAEKQMPQPPADSHPADKANAAEAEKAAAEPEKAENAAEDAAKKSPEDRRRAFGEMMQGEYADLFGEAMQHAIETAKTNILQDPKLTALGQALRDAYGIDTSDLDGLIEAVKAGRVKDEAYYEEMAQQRGISVKTAKELDKLESENKRMSAAQQQAEALRQAAEHQQRAAAYRAQWEAQAAQLKAQYPDFALDEVLANPDVADMMRRGVSLPNAYRACYFDKIMAGQVAAAAQQVEQGVTARIQQRNARPGENGTRPGGAVQTKLDVNSLTRKEREALERRALHGEKITFSN